MRAPLQEVFAGAGPRAAGRRCFSARITLGGDVPISAPIDSEPKLPFKFYI